MSQISYNDFHTKNTEFVTNAIFGGKPSLLFPQNNFVLNQCDVKQIEPADQAIRENLKQTNAKALELKTQATELEYQLKAKIEEEESHGELEVQALKDETEAARKMVELDKMQVDAKAIEVAGVEIAKARAKAEANMIGAQSTLEQSESHAQSFAIETATMIKSMKLQNTKVEDQTREHDNMEIHQKESLMKMEVAKFKQLVDSIGVDTIKAMAKSGPENKAKLLKSLGLEGYLVTDGATPVNLFNAAQGLIKRE